MRERGHGVVQDELQSRPPRVVPDILERTDDAGRDEMPVVVVRLREQVQANGEIGITGMKIHRLLGTRWRDVIEQFLREITVRVDQADAMPLQDELEDEVAQQCGLARAGLADDVGVKSSIGHIKPKRHLAAPDFAFADVKVLIVHAAQASRRSMIDEPDERPRRVVGASPARHRANASLASPVGNQRLASAAEP